MARRVKASELKGRNLYHDDRGRTVYYDWIRRKGYFITNYDVTQYIIYTSDFAMASLALCIVYWLTNNILYSVGAFAIVLAGFIALKEIFFVRKLNEVKHFAKPKYNYVKDLVENEEPSHLLLVGIGAILLGALLVANGIVSKFDTLSMVVSVIAAGVAVAVGSMNIYAYFLQKSKVKRK